eukprot:5843076-Pyramimonas_sp.AAC.1
MSKTKTATKGHLQSRRCSAKFARGRASFRQAMGGPSIVGGVLRPPPGKFSESHKEEGFVFPDALGSDGLDAEPRPQKARIPQGATEDPSCP